MPRLRTTETGMTWSVPTRISDTSSRWRRRLDVDQRTSGLCSIQLEPVGAHPPGHIIDAGRDAVLKLLRCRRTTQPIDLSVICIQIRAETMTLNKQVSSVQQEQDRSKDRPLWYATQNQVLRKATAFPLQGEGAINNC